MEVRSRIWELVEGVVRDEGFCLFDLELPNARSKFFRVFITKDNSKNIESKNGVQAPSDQKGVAKAAGVLLDDCARISRRISPLLDTEVETPENYVLEVSSPGVNRRLRRAEHFVGAIGERVRMKMRSLPANTIVDRETHGTAPAKRVVLGTLLAAQILSSGEGCEISIADEEHGGTIVVPIQDVEEARVDFKF
jgi:ribosome maturation factor RimP